MNFDEIVKRAGEVKQAQMRDKRRNWEATAEFVKNTIAHDASAAAVANSPALAEDAPPPPMLLSPPTPPMPPPRPPPPPLLLLLLGSGVTMTRVSSWKNAVTRECAERFLSGKSWQR